MCVCQMDETRTSWGKKHERDDERTSFPRAAWDLRGTHRQTKGGRTKSILAGRLS